MDKLQELLKAMEITEDSIKEIVKLVQETVDLKLLEGKELQEAELKEQFEADYAAFSDELVEKLSMFLDETLKENLEIPAEVVEWAKKGKEYSQILEALKVKIQLDEGALNEEATKKLDEANAAAGEMKDKLDAALAENLKLADKIQKFETVQHIDNKCAEAALSVDETANVKKLMNGFSIEEVDEKFETVVKFVKGKASDDTSEDDTTDENVDGKGSVIVEDDNQDDDNNVSEAMKSFREACFGE